MVELLDWVNEFPYHPVILIIAVIAEVLFWLGFTSLVYHWFKGDPLKIERENEDAANPVFIYENQSGEEE